MTLHGCSAAITDEFDRSEFDRVGISNAEIDAKARALIGTHLSDRHMSMATKSPVQQERCGMPWLICTTRRTRRDS